MNSVNKCKSDDWTNKLEESGPLSECVYKKVRVDAKKWVVSTYFFWSVI